MVSAAFSLMIITVVGGLVYFGLERKLASAPLRSSAALRCSAVLTLRTAAACLPQALQLNANYMVRTPRAGASCTRAAHADALHAHRQAFMAQLEDTLACVSNSTDPVPAGNCTDVNGPAMYQALIDNYMQDPNTLVDVWGPTTNTLYLFAFTIVSTIGYGTFAPKTAGGQIFTIFYALVRFISRIAVAFAL